MAELKLEDRYEKKRNHIFWFSVVATILAISLYDDPEQRRIDVFKSGINVDVSHIGLLLLVILVYQAVSFWFEDRKVALLNSELAKRGDFADAKDAIQAEANTLISDARDRLSAVLERLDDDHVRETSNFLNDLTSELYSLESDLQHQIGTYSRWSGDDELDEDTRNSGRMGLQLGIDKILIRLKQTRDKIESIDLTDLANVEATLADAKLANERVEQAATGISTDLSSLLSDLYAVRGDLSRLDRFQLLVFERHIPYIALLAGLLSSLILVFRSLLVVLTNSSS